MKIMCLILVVLLLLSGCDGAVKPTESTPAETVGNVPMNTEGTDKPNSETTGTQETEGKKEIPKVEDIAYQVPEYDGEQKVPYDPNWQVYFSTYNMDMDFYPDVVFRGFCVTVITKEYYAPEEIQLNIPAQTPYEISVSDVTDPPDLTKIPEGTDWDGPGKYMDYHYLCQQDIDWQEYAQMSENKRAADSVIIEYIAELNRMGKRKEYSAYDEAYRKMRDAYQAQYDALEVTDPPFNAYWIDVSFTDIGAYEETIETFEYVLGDESYTVDIGQIRFHTESPEELTVGRSHDRIVRGMDPSTTQYNGGYYRLREGEAFVFSADKDLTVTGMRQLGVEVGVLGAHVTITGSSDVDFYWDLQRPIEIQKGDYVSITLYLKDERFTQYEMNITTYFILDYEINGKAYTMCMPCNFWRFNYHCWDIYLMMDQGYDIGQYYYYACYLKPEENYWLRELPEEWQE